MGEKSSGISEFVIAEHEPLRWVEKVALYGTKWHGFGGPPSPFCKVGIVLRQIPAFAGTLASGAGHSGRNHDVRAPPMLCIVMLVGKDGAFWRLLALS
jgi:hypothetical protein